MSGQKKAITPKAMATKPRSSSSHQFSASAANTAEPTSGMRGPGSACVDIVFPPWPFDGGLREARLAEMMRNQLCLGGTNGCDEAELQDLGYAELVVLRSAI